MAHAQGSHGYGHLPAPSSSDPELQSPLNSAHTGGGSVDIEPSPPEFHPMMEGRLWTALDATISSDCGVHPTASLSYDDLPQELREIFKKNRVYLEKHLDLVNYLLLHSPNEVDKTTEASEKEGLRRLGIPVPTTQEGDKKKWQCSVVGCKYKGTLQHLIAHFRTKTHLDIRTFACPSCKALFHHAHDRDRHKREETCIESRQVEKAAEPQGSRRSLRGSQEQSAPMPKGKGKPRASRHEGGHQDPAQTHAQGVEYSLARNHVYHDPRFQASIPYDSYNPSIPPTSSAHPVLPVHQTPAYQHMQSQDVSTAQQGYTAVHPAYHAPQLPGIFPAPSPYVLPTNHGGMHANSITNNYIHHTHSPTGNFQVAGNPQFPLAAPIVSPTYAQPRPVPHLVQSSNGNTANHSHRHSPQVPRGMGQYLPPPYLEQDRGHYSHHEGGGMMIKRPRTSMSSGRTPVAPSLQTNPQDPANTIRGLSQPYWPPHPQTGHPC